MPEGKHDWSRLDAMSDEDILAAAWADPDAQPWTDADLARAKPLSPVAVLRHSLALTRAEFAARYHIPLALLTEWEEDRAAPDTLAEAYLRVIAREPERVRIALDSRAADAA